jgi:hypothetical protein
MKLFWCQPSFLKEYNTIREREMFCVICCGDRRDSCVFDGQRNDSF